MSSVINSLGQALAPVASTATQGSGTVGRNGSTGSAMSSNGQVPSTVQTAAVVSLSQDGKSRAATRGESRRVDATYDKQETHSGKAEKDKGESGGKSPGGINVEA